MRIGYQSPNARLAATVGAIAKSCAPAGITVQDAASETVGPLSLRDNEIDVLIASTGGAAGSGSTGASAMDAYELHTGNGNNLSGYSNERIDGIIATMAVTVRPEGTGPAARRRRTDPVGRHADASALPSAADPADFEEDVCGEQQSDSMGRGLEHGPVGAGQ